MDDFVQQIRIADIIPSNNEFEENDINMTELTNSIRKHGIVEPLLLRPCNGKYEILLGNKRYAIAKNLNFETVPALVKNIDEELYQEYKKLNNLNKKRNNNKFINPNPQYDDTKKYPKKSKKEHNKEQNTPENINNPIEILNNQKNTNNSDIINLSELNKEEYEERDEIKMNNNMPTNQEMPAQNGGPVVNEQAPSFGGRFFPSLEDEPTNMEMGTTNIIGQAMRNATPVAPQVVPNNNLIDLTDVNGENQSMPQPPQNMETNMPTSQQPMMANYNMMNNNNQMEGNIYQNNQNFNNPSINNLQQEFTMNTPSPIPDPVADMNMQQINSEPADSFSSMTEDSIVQNTVVSPEMPENNMAMDTVNQNVGGPIGEPQFDMSQSMMPEPNISMQNDMIPPMENVGPTMPNNNYDLPQPPEMPNYMLNDNVEPNNMNTVPSDVNEMQPAPYTDINANIPTQEFASEEVSAYPVKDIEPVINTIKDLANNLQNFGYNIRMNEENLDTSIKLIIEIDK